MLQKINQEHAWYYITLRWLKAGFNIERALDQAELLYSEGNVESREQIPHATLNMFAEYGWLSFEQAS